MRIVPAKLYYSIVVRQNKNTYENNNLKKYMKSYCHLYCNILFKDTNDPKKELENKVRNAI